MATKPFLWVSVAIALLCTPTSAGSQYAIRGYGAVSCGTWTKEHEQRSSVSSAMDHWLLGYITAVNRWGYKGADIAAGIDANGLVAHVSRYCEAKPLDTLADASIDLIVELLAREIGREHDGQ